MVPVLPRRPLYEICFSLSLSTIGDLLCPVVLKFHDAVPWCGYIFTHCAGHLVSLFHLGTHVLQFWLLLVKIVSLIMSTFFSPLCMFYLPMCSLKHLLFRCASTELFPQYSYFFYFPSFCLLFSELFILKFLCILFLPSF